MSALHNHEWRRPGEPVYSIYGIDWVQARKAIRSLPDKALRKHLAALFDCVEEGWSIVRPLQLVAEAAGRPSEDVFGFVDLEVTDNFRWLAEASIRFIPKGGQFSPAAPTDDVGPELEILARNLRLLALMEASPAFPVQFRGMVEPAATAFTEWATRMEEVAEPIIDTVERALEEMEEADG